MKTRDCNPVTGYGWPRDMAKHMFGHEPHAFVAGIGPWRHAYRCRGSEPIDIPPTIQEQQLAELRRIREVLES